MRRYEVRISHSLAKPRHMKNAPRHGHLQGDSHSVCHLWVIRTLECLTHESLGCQNLSLTSLKTAPRRVHPIYIYIYIDNIQGESVCHSHACTFPPVPTVAFFFQKLYSHVNESCPTWMSHVSCKRGMSLYKARRHAGWSAVVWSCLFMSHHISHEWVMSHVTESCLISKQGDTPGWFSVLWSHSWVISLMSHRVIISHINESCLM